VTEGETNNTWRGNRRVGALDVYQQRTAGLDRAHSRAPRTAAIRDGRRPSRLGAGSRKLCLSSAPFFQDPGAVQDRAQVVQAYFNIQAVTVLDKKLVVTV
jgi:hypothetical protein